NGLIWRICLRNGKPASLLIRLFDGERTGSLDGSGVIRLEHEAKAAARAAQLRYVSDRRPGITRERVGEAFVYRYPDGTPVCEEEVLARIKRLAIPPAWDEVWICPAANGHIQAVGRDARRRKQYRYHARWRE